MSVFEPAMEAILDKVVVAAPGGFGGRTFTFRPEMARMTSSGKDTQFTTKSGSEDAIHRAAFVNALLGALMERQDTWGALFNHPRTLVIGPDAAFQCRTNKGGFGIALATKDGQRVSVYDVDQVVWVNHCADEQSLPLGLGGSNSPVIEIGVMRMNHDSRTTDKVTPEVGAVRFNGTGGNPISADLKNTKDVEVDDIVDLFSGSDVNIVAVNTANTDTPRVGDGHMEHLLRAATVLEHVMRYRTLPLKDLLDIDVHLRDHRGLPGHMHKAVSAGKVPYAAKDLDPDQMQPPVMPGKADRASIISVMKDVLGYGSSGGVAASASNPYSALDFGSPSKPITNPYSSLGFEDDADANADTDVRPISPFLEPADEDGF